MKDEQGIIVIFGKNVKKERERQNISQEAFAFKAGINRTYIGRIERAERKLSLINAKKIADALGVSIDSLLVNSDTI